MRRDRTQEELKRKICLFFSLSLFNRRRSRSRLGTAYTPGLAWSGLVWSGVRRPCARDEMRDGNGSLVEEVRPIASRSTSVRVGSDR